MVDIDWPKALDMNIIRWGISRILIIILLLFVVFKRKFELFFFSIILPILIASF